MRWLPALVAAAVLAAAPDATAAPNVVVIQTDDQTVADLEAMPRTRALIAEAGTAFRNSHVSLSQCCPSRATLLTGRYAHNHGVLASSRPYGGIERLAAAETLPVWLRRAGYETALVGKYLNGYGARDPTQVPPGWSEWHGLLGSSTYRYYDYWLNHDGRLTRYGYDPADYQTDVLTTRAEDVVRRRAGGAAPLFLWVAYVAPHTGQPLDVLDPPGASAVPAPRHRAALLATLAPLDFEPDVSDKPRAIRRRDLVDPLLLRERRRQRRESLLAVDDGVARIVAALRAAGELEDTLLIFTSDNGYMEGQHRVAAGKVLPYAPSTAVPLLIRGPGVPAGAQRSQLVWNGDLAPTILAAAGARSPWPADGLSLWPFLRRPGLRSPRALVLEAPPGRRTGSVPRFRGLRTPRYLYVEHSTLEVELYDTLRDPGELRNLARERRPLRRRLHRRLARLLACRGAACRS